VPCFRNARQIRRRILVAAANFFLAISFAFLLMAVATAIATVAGVRYSLSTTSLINRRLKGSAISTKQQVNCIFPLASH
jgi:hypothetical protein